MATHLVRSNAETFFHVDYSESAKSDPMAYSAIFRQEVNRRYDSLTVTETNDLVNRVVDLNKPKRCYEIAGGLVALSIAAGVAGLFCPLLFLVAAGLLIAAIAMTYEGVSAKNENFKLANEYVRGLVHRDRREREETHVTSQTQTERRLHENTMVKLGQECLTKLGNQEETFIQGEIYLRLNQLKSHYHQLSPDQQKFIEDYVKAELNSESQDPIQTIADTLRVDRSSSKAQKALQYGALAIILLSKNQAISSLLENKSVPSRYDNLLQTLEVTVEEQRGNELLRVSRNRELEISVNAQDATFKDKNGQMTRLKINRVFTISAPDSLGHVRIKARRAFRHSTEATL